MSRLEDIQKFYNLMQILEEKLRNQKDRGERILSQCEGNMGWPERGICFFFEPGEERTTSGDGPRVVRVDTHAISSGSKTALWTQLSHHKGNTRTGGGNHRDSDFRKIVGSSLIRKYKTLSSNTWGKGTSVSKKVSKQERLIEQEVTNIIGQMPFLWLEVNDEPSENSHRAILQQNIIALLSNWDKEPIDPTSENWLGTYCPTENVKSSGLWNTEHVDTEYDPVFLAILEAYIAKV